MNIEALHRTALCVLLSLFSGAARAQANTLDMAKIDQITGAKGALNEGENVYKVSFPRDDVKVDVDGVRMPPFMGLTSWAAFKPGEKDGVAMVMGDMVLFQDEVNPAMSAALDSDLNVTALHNHFFLHGVADTGASLGVVVYRFGSDHTAFSCEKTRWYAARCERVKEAEVRGGGRIHPADDRLRRPRRGGAALPQCAVDRRRAVGRSGSQPLAD